MSDSNGKPFGFGTLSNIPMENTNQGYVTVTHPEDVGPISCPSIANVATSTENGVYIPGYALFLQQEYDKPYEGNPCPPVYPVITYLDEGTVESGMYAGYHRIIGFRTWDGPGGEVPSPYFFITKDYKTYKIVTHPLMYVPDLADGKTALASFQTIVDKNKVTGIVDDVKDKINFPYPHTLGYGSFIYKLTGVNQSIPKNAREINDTIRADMLASDARFGTYGYGVGSDEKRAELAKPFEVLKTYYEGTTKIYRTNRDGHTATYSLVFDPTLRGSTEKTYTSYGQSTPTPCGINPDLYTTKNISIDELRKIGVTKTDTEIYVLKDLNHPILKAQYIEKVGQYASDVQTFASLNGQKTAKMPTYEEYVAKNPIIFFKDFFGRLVALGEFDYKIDGGCGKPVIYLYPKTPTTVRVSFKNAVQLTTHIPAYSYGDRKGWAVRVEPDGTLHDVSDEAEDVDCDIYEDAHVGSEYALEACEKNEYPYIYWAGNTFEKYPNMKEGFVVKANKLKQTLEDKLEQIGLSEKEVNDMVEYWYPEMIKNKTPYYRISFMQTAVLNKFIPMNVIPKPDTTIRVFLDWEPLSSFKVVAPQILTKTSRTGFTYVEWGGLRR